MIDELESAEHIVVIQAENPDADSVASSLALEQILAASGKDVSMYCPMQIPRHLRYLPGWDRIERDLPAGFDATIIVDASQRSLLERVLAPEQEPIIKSRPVFVIDHHDIESNLPFDIIELSDKSAASTGEVIYNLATEHKWKLNDIARDMIAVSIMADTLGLTTAETTPRTIRIIAELVEAGVKLHELDDKRRATMKRSHELTVYKGQLLQRVEVSLKGKLAEITIPWEEIEKYSDQYNPSMLVLDDMRLIETVSVAVAYKIYSDGHITAKIRANYESPVADKLAETMGGGGHQYAAGFKTYDFNIDEVKKRVANELAKLLETDND